MKLLVTGGAGYIGSVVAAQLLQAGHEVTVLDDLSTGHEDAVPAGATFVKADLLDRGAVDDVLNGAGFLGVLHFAAKSLVQESVEHPGLYYRNNVAGTLTLLEAMRDSSVPRLVFSSTAATYGEPSQVPILETAPTMPTNPYGASKLAVDSLIGAFCAAYGLAGVSLRYFNVAGASATLGERHATETHLIPLVLQVAAGIRPHIKIFGTDYPTPDGSAIRDYIHVEDLGRAHLLALSALGEGEGRHEIFNLGNQNGFSVRQVIDAARAVTGRRIDTVEAPRRPGDPAVLVASSEKLRGMLGWQADKPSLEAMIGDAWEFAQRS